MQLQYSCKLRRKFPTAIINLDQLQPLVENCHSTLRGLASSSELVS